MERTIYLMLWVVILFMGNVNITFSQDAMEGCLSTGLPVCYVNYPADSVITKERKLDAQIIILTASDTVRYQAELSGRGNSTWGTPKRPYNLKFNDNVSILGIRSCKKYALMANWFDKSMLRICIGCKLGELLDFDYNLHGRYVELVLNGEHKGCYYLVERVCRNNVPYDKNTGCILEYRYTSQLKADETYFLSALKNWTFGFKEPDDPVIGGDVYNNAIRKINEFEEAVYSPDTHTRRRWSNLMDWDNFVKWYYWKNILQMDECNRFYVIEDNLPSSKIKMGPIWDFDWTLGMSMSPRQHYYTPYFRNKLFYDTIGVDSLFLNKVAEFHFAHRDRLESELDNIYDSLSVLLSPTEKLDESLWGTFSDSLSTWHHELELDRAFLKTTFTFLDQKLAPYKDITIDITNMCTPTSTNSEVKIEENNRIVIVRNGKRYTTTGLRIQ